MSVSKVWRTIPQYYNLEGTACRSCQAKFFPPREICSECGKHPLPRFIFKGSGEIVTFTVVRNQMGDPEGEILDIHFFSAPYILAIIRLDEGPMVTSQVVDCEPDEMEIGKRVRAVFRKIMEKGKHGVIQYGYKFRLDR